MELVGEGGGDAGPRRAGGVDGVGDAEEAQDDGVDGEDGLGDGVQWREGGTEGEWEPLADDSVAAGGPSRRGPLGQPTPGERRTA